jgi:hypothetical protein
MRIAYAANSIEQIMCSLAVDLNAASQGTGFDVEKQFSDALDCQKPFKDDGSVHLDGYRVEVTKRAGRSCAS